MAGGWTRDGAVQDQIDDTVKDAIAAARLRMPAGEAMVVTGWSIESEGRKHRVGTALHDRDGTLCAKAAATWVTIG